MKLYAVILCGGRGERFWPRSRRALPKQFISLFGGQTMLQATSARLAGICPRERQVFVAPAGLEPAVRRQVHPRKHGLLLEPAGRNTAPAIGLAAAYLSALEPDSMMLVLPSDHVVTDRGEFRRCVRLAVGVAQRGLLVTFGVPPSRPDTGYGYVHIGRVVANRAGLTAHEVLGFREKPDIRKARLYLADGDHLWNSGMFVWPVRTILRAFERFMPEFREALECYAEAVKAGRGERAVKRLYEEAPSISIDYAVMEKADNIAAVRASFGWDDVGSWLALARHSRPDENGNATQGLFFGRDTKDCIVQTDTGVVAVLGVRDLVIVRSGDALLVAHRDRVGEVKEILKQMAEEPKARRFL